MLNKYRYEFLLLLCSLLAALGWIFSKESIKNMPPATFLTFRFFITALLLLPFCWRQLWQSSPKYLLISLGTNCFQALGLAAWIYAISISPTLSEGGFITSLVVIFAPMAAWMIFKQKPAQTFFMALPFTLLGLFFLTKGSHGWRVDASQLLYLLSAFLLAINFIFNQAFNKLSVIVYTFIQMLVTGFVCWFTALILNEDMHWQLVTNNPGLHWFLGSVFICTLFRYFLQIKAQRHCRVDMAALIMSLEPVWVFLLSTTLYGEKLAAIKLLGCGCLLFSVLVYRGVFRHLIRIKRQTS